MKLTPEIEAKGLKAYEQVCAFEALRRRKLPWIYTGFSLLLAALGVLMLRHDQLKLAEAFLLGAVLFAWGSGWSWRKLMARYAVNVQVVNELEKTYGDQLQWVKVEKHFAALAKLQRELAMEKRAEGE